MHQDLRTLEELIRKKQETVDRLDDELFQEIERQKVIEELMDGMSLVSSSREYPNHSASLNSSSCSEQSCDTEYLQNEIDKVKDYMQVVRQTGELPQIPEHLQLTQSSHQKKKKYPSKIRENLMATRLKLKADQKPSETVRKQSEDLRQLNEQSLKAEFQENQKTISNMNLKRQYLEKVTTLRTAWREESLQYERSLIRQQLIEEEGEHVRLTATVSTPFLIKSNSVIGQPEVESFLNDPLLRAQRTSRINSLVRCFGRANNQAAVLGLKLDKLLVFR